MFSDTAEHKRFLIMKIILLDILLNEKNLFVNTSEKNIQSENAIGLSEKKFLFSFETK